MVGTAHSIKEVLRHATHVLPAQGPIAVFVHHNTLHAFQHLPFEKAVVEAAQVFGAQPFMTEERFHQELAVSRIRREDLEAVLAGTEDAEILPGRLTRHQLRLARLQCAVLDPDPATLEWELEEGWFQAMGRHDLFDICVEKLLPLGISSVSPKLPPVWTPDVTDEIHPLLIRMCCAFIDQGLSYWPMPSRELGFYECVRELVSLPGFIAQEWFVDLPGEFRRQKELGLNAEDSVLDALHEFQVPAEEWLAFIEQQFIALPGWPGMFNRMEEEPELAEHVRVPVSLMDYLAVRLTMVRVAAKSAGPAQTGSAAVLVPAQGTRPAAARMSIAAAAVGLTAAELDALPLQDVQKLHDEVERFDALERRRFYFLAYERRHERQILRPIQAHRRSLAIRKRSRAAAQLFFCIDEREESLRRHLEEVDPALETEGAAGFFAVAINYAGIDDGLSVSLCPVVVKPAHAVREKPIEEHAELHKRRQALRRLLSRGYRSGRMSSRELVRGWIATGALGIFSVFPLLLRILSPLTYGKLRRRLNEVIVPRPRTELSFTRTSDEKIQGLAHGFSVQEKADRVAAMLGGAGLTDSFSRLVVIVGHGSTSINNPHESAYNCGACSGRRGAPNARLFAAIANEPEVRAELAKRGLHLPDDTWFLGGYHDTASDDVDLFDLEQLPETHRPDLERVRKALDRARALDAHERARRFAAFNSKESPEKALRHAQERTEHLAEPRPEYGHGSNALTIVARREITRGLFLDRRAFLVSYDAKKDPEDKFLAAQLAAAIPVCGGISLEYYFSTVDNEVYGCGTKLPHNVAGLIGVMNGHASDLRTGLPIQTVEIHEPVRGLFIIETTPERLMGVIDGSPLLKEWVRNDWVRLSTIDPDTGLVQVFRNGSFEPLDGEQPDIPEAPTSVDWYRGRTDNLPIARIGHLPEAA